MICCRWSQRSSTALASLPRGSAPCLRKGDGDGDAVHRRDERAAPDLGVTDARVHLLVLVLAVSHLRLDPFLPGELLVPGLVEKVRTAEADEGHLQERVPDEQSRHDAGDRDEVVPEPEALRLAGEHANEHIREHGEDITRIAADITEAVQSEAREDALPAACVRLFGSGFPWLFLPGHLGLGSRFRRGLLLFVFVLLLNLLFPFIHLKHGFRNGFSGGSLKLFGFILFLVLSVRFDPFLLVTG